MSKANHVLAGSAVVAIAGAAHGDFTGVTAVDIGNPNAGETTYRLHAHFTSPTDQLLAVSGHAQITPIIFTTNTVLINDGGTFAGQVEEDFAAFPNSGLYDSWVTIAHSVFAGNDTAYSPGFDPLGAYIQGSSWSIADEGWFDTNPATSALGTSILIAQFTVADTEDGAAGDVTLQGTVAWQPGPGELTSEFFLVTTVPAPGALALLALAGCVGRRRG